jgi:two-component system response regulator GlrR
VALYRPPRLLCPKTRFARAIHYLSARVQQPFIPVNCGAIPVDLVENELFGHARGAFTGAATTTAGLIQEADGGTLFLDEIDTLPSLAQVKLLRFLQEKEYRPLGSAKIHHANLRVIAASNAAVEQAVAEGKFRQDLYYRLNVIPLILPLLRDRQDDIPLLARHFLRKYAAEFQKNVTAFSAGALQKLVHHTWPGNVRELEHLIERAVVLSQWEIIEEQDLRLPEVSVPHAGRSFKQAKAEAIVLFERAYLQNLLIASQGSLIKAARTAQKHRRALWQLIHKHGIDSSRFKTSW